MIGHGAKGKTKFASFHARISFRPPRLDHSIGALPIPSDEKAPTGTSCHRGPLITAGVGKKDAMPGLGAARFSWRRGDARVRTDTNIGVLSNAASASRRTKAIGATRAMEGA
jgi:hypothetical protein